MPRASSNPEKAVAGGAKFESGRYRVKEWKFQNLKSDFKGTCVNGVGTLVPIDEKGEVPRDADTVDLRLGFGEKSAEHFHPGRAKSAEDEDPEDLGSGVDVEGNTVWCDGGAELHKSCAWIVFTSSLLAAGYPKEKLDATYAPNFIGLDLEIQTLKAEEINKRFNLRLNTKPPANSQSGDGITMKVVTKWLNPNKFTANGSAAAQAPASTGTQDETLEDIAMKVMGVFSEGGKTIKTKAQLTGLVTNECVKLGVKGPQLAQVKAFFAKPEWLAEQVEAFGGTMDGEKISFSAS